MSGRSSADDTFNTALKQDAGDLERWLEAVWAHQIPEPDEFNWLGLATATASKSLHSIRRDESEAWARIAISIYDWLALQTPSSNRRFSLYLAAMNLRAALIVKVGAVTGDSLLDPTYVEALFDRYCPISYEDTVQRLATKQKLSLNELQALRRVKNMLAPISLLAKSGYIKKSSKLNAWLILQRDLP